MGWSTLPLKGTFYLVSKKKTHTNTYCITFHTYRTLHLQQLIIVDPGIGKLTLHFTLSVIYNAYKYLSQSINQILFPYYIYNIQGISQKRGICDKNQNLQGQIWRSNRWVNKASKWSPLILQTRNDLNKERHNFHITLNFLTLLIALLPTPIISIIKHHIYGNLLM